MPEVVGLLLSVLFGAIGAAAFHGVNTMREREWKREAERQTREWQHANRASDGGRGSGAPGGGPHQAPRVNQYGELVD